MLKNLDRFKLFKRWLVFMRQADDRDEAVSPVIATVLLLAITVMLTSMVFVIMQGAVGSVDKRAPNVTVNVKGLSNGYHVIRFVDMDQHLDPSMVVYRLDSDKNTQGFDLEGRISDGDVYGRVGTNVSFHDRDAGWTINEGDYLVINSEELGAQDGGWKLTLISQQSNAVVAEVILPEIE